MVAGLTLCPELPFFHVITPLGEYVQRVSKESGSIGKILIYLLYFFRLMIGAMVLNLEDHCLQSWTLKENSLST